VKEVTQEERDQQAMPEVVVQTQAVVIFRQARCDQYPVRLLSIHGEHQQPAVELAYLPVSIRMRMAASETRMAT
tara:strand:- start:382 stop:603 length:222 start_codon:yes stop_codon:yes gene_type:complete